MASNSELIREALPQGYSSQDSEGETDSDEEHLRMLLPTLLKQLQTILSEYPDSSQIIKEIIQNADDADATEMKICYESCRSHPDPEQTWSKYFAAPALCFYNDAEFSKKDWEGIRTIYSSVKEEDPLKVGRFGLGFKSVFHITDHPTIISGDQLLVIDPHQRDLDYVCWRKRLKKAAGLKTSLSAIFGKFGFTENSLESGKFRGTLFWLPLREKPSKLSNNLYSNEKINNLFHSFKTEAPVTLLFLKSLEKIEWFDGSNMLYRVQVRETGGHIRCERKRFQQEIKAKNKTQENTDVVSKTEMSIETKSCSDRDSEEQIQGWLVVNLLKREKLSDEMRLLLEDKSLSYPPYVGVAVPLNMDMSEFKGHVFCFLPLPLEARSITGLPVHVNGFFALSQNRRHVKWSSAGEKRNNCISWNEGLVKELLPEAYNILLQKLIVNSEDNNNTSETLSLVHKSIPDDKCVLDNWRLLLDPLYSAILKENFLYTINNCWVDYAKCVLPPVQSMDKVIWKVVRHLYHQAGEHLVEVPKHIVQMLQKHVSGGVITASPDHLCHILRSSDAVYKDLSVCEKLYLLNFLACDEQYSRLEGLKLLPLNDQNFLTFKKDTGGDCHIFHCSLEEIQMFPGLGHMVVMSDFPYELPVAIGKMVREHILNIANQGVYQIFNMMPNDTPKLIELTIQKNSEQMFESGISFWFISDTTVLSDSWIDNIWEYLKKHFDDLRLFSHLPIVTYLNNKSTGGKRLYKLSETMILRTRRGADSLPESLCEALECLGVLVLPSLKESMLSHPCLLDTFVKGPSVHGVVQIISQCSATGVTNFNKICSSENKRALVDYLDGIKEIPEAALCTLRRLELFLLTEGPETATCYGSVEKCREVAPKQKLSINFPRPLLYLKNTAERHLASFLGCSTIILEELVAEILQKILSVESENMEQAYYSSKEIQIFMEFFLNNIEQFEKLTKAAINVRFLGEDLNTANKLYDPEDPLLQDLFLYEPRFPNTPFDSPSMVGSLKKLGLHSSDNIHVHDLLETAQCITRNKVLDEIWTKKSNALLKVLEECPYLLEDLTLKEGLGDLMWITPADKLNGYPDILPRHGLTSLCRPSDVCSDSYIHIAGSVMPIISTTCKKLLNVFGWDRPPPMDIVFKQLDIVSQQYQIQYKPKLYESIRLIYEHLSSRMNEITEEHRTKLNQSNCVWTEGGFCQPNSVYIKQTCTDIDLKPYLFLLPPEWNNYSAFFRNLDCYDSQTTDALLTVQEAIRLKWESMAHAQTSSQKDLQILIQILNELKQKSLGISDKEKILFPTCLTNESQLVLKPAPECTYCDTEWLQEFSKEDTVILIHPDVPNNTAEALGVVSLMQNLFSDAEGIQEWGQQEPLTTRLHSLLEGYSDGFSVLKEIVQNADDAGATEVSFLYDEREHDEQQSCLIDEAMGECQGPALWAYNDAEFTDADFENITRLCGATKEMDNTKIGKFGLGFSAVYNLTDVPSIVSRNKIVIFDPHMKYLGKLIAGKQPGLKIDVSSMKSKLMLKKMKNQFLPYNGVFNCDVMGEKSNFSGTLFRFPLRTENQAITSKISKIIYNRLEMKKLLKIFMESAANLLLFTQHVELIKIFHLKAENLDPQKAVLVHEVKRQVVDEIPQVIKDIGITQYVSSLIKNENMLSNQMQFELCYRIKIQVTVSAVTGICDLTLGSQDSYWIISWALGTKEALNMALKTKMSALPLGSVAIPVIEDGEHFLPCDLAETPTGFYKDGHAFCFLPLPIKTSLPVHINGCFALSSDRCHMCSWTEDDKECYGYEWNQALLKDAICRAYLLLIEKLQNIINVSMKYSYHQLWPADLSSHFSAIASQFFTTVANDNLKVFCREGVWVSLNNCLFLDEYLKSDVEVANIAFSALTKFKRLDNEIVLDLPSEINDWFINCGCGKLIDTRTVALKQFYEKTFLQNISDVYWNAEERNKLLLFAIDNANTRHMLSQYKCIPCRPNEQLRYPCELIDPHSSVARLFDEDDGRFPIGDEETFLEPSRRISLKQMGMMDTIIPEDLVIEMAVSVVTLADIDCEKAFKKCVALLEYLGSENILISLSTETLQKVTDIEFMPAMQKPPSWPLCWKAEETTNTLTGTVWASPGSLFCQEAKWLVGSQNFIVNDLQLEMNNEKKKTLFCRIGVHGVDGVPLDTVLDHLTAVSQVKFKGLDFEEQSTIKTICSQTYQYLDNMCSENDQTVCTTVISRLTYTECVLTDFGFCLPNMVLLSQHASDLDVYPHMCTLPHESNKYLSFFNKLSCHKRQTVFSLLDVMRKIRDIYDQGKSQSKEAVQRDLRIIIQILNNMKSSESEIDTGQLLFPTCLTDESKLVLKSAADCTYCDAGWLKDLLEDDDDLILVHPDVSNSTAKALGVKSLTQTLLSDTEGIQEWGQKEPLTRRLHHLLEGYSDGFSVPKEILQNADDAGATEVCFLYDERENKNVRSGLIDEGMAECQGPALWAYNDAEFTDADFENIVKLNGATKENDRTKIGKFGLGFSAVYNLTDVPSIVSKNTAVIFDPHMKYLGKAVKGREPGIKINLTSVKNKMMLKKMKNQFKPYKGVFGCDITSENHSSFCGTLFRFPLRTKDQAIASDISKIAYDKHEIQNLFKIFTQSAGNLLLFSQHVHNMKLFHLPAGEDDPSQAELLMEVKKEDLETIPRNLPVLHNCNDKKTMMQLAADVMEQVANNQEQPVSMPTKWCGRLRIGIQYPSEKSDLIDASLTDSESQWIIAWATGTTLSLKLSLEQSRPGSLPFGSVAMLVKEEGGLIIPCDVREAADGFYKQGHIFCFLPLPIKTSLPVHINGCFAVTSDRRSLSHPSEDEKVREYSNDWNEAVMTDTVCNAYVLLLEKIHEFCVSPDYQYHQFWPTDISSKDCSALCKQLYRSIAHESPRVFYGSNQWQALENCLFLDPDFRSNVLVGDIAYNTLVHFKSSADVNVVDFPRVILTAFEKQGCQQAVQKHIVSMECFFKEVFFPNIHSQYWTVNERDALTLFALDSADIRELLKQHRCVPCKPDGELRYPSDVVNPMSFVACMFGESDGRFPLDSNKQTFCTENRLLILRSLGMIENTVPVNLLVDRAQSVVVLNQTDGVGALERCKSVLKYLAQINISEQQLLSEISTKLHDIPFLPVLKKPEFWPIHWHADIVLQHKDVKTETMQLFASGSELFHKSAMYCVGALRLVLDKECFAAGSYTVAKLLGVAMKDDLPLDIVAQQLLLISNTDCDQLHDKQIRQLEITCSEIYVFLNKKCSDNKENNLEILQNKSILFLNQHLVQSCKTAYQKLPCDCTPELFSLCEREPLWRLRNFLTAVGVKEHFDPDDINDVIGLMKEKYGSEPLPEIQLNLICNLVISLAKLVKDTGTKTSGTVFMPDKSGVLWNVNDLCRDDGEFDLHMDRLHVVHSSISHNVAELLGVKTIRQQNLKHYSRGLPFGQSEKLTTRLKHLVNAYPRGIEIMKELLQNADDAGASKLHFIKDFRQHPCKTVFEDSWKPLQGPALCAYNDSSFTRADLEGIQRLGEGSKSMDPTKTGKYGVGFNAVYHLTDVPSFLTKGENVDGGETLCVLDPHCLYVPGATAESPGEQYVELGDLRTDFPDVFDCYPDKMFDSDSGTLFRFPLRDEEMAKESQIKNQPITDNDVNELIDIFKKEMMENLLFMKNVTSLAVYNMTADGLFEEEYVMNASMSEDCKNKRQEFFNYLKSVVQEIQNGTLNVCDIEKKQVTYKMTLHDNKGLSQTWCIVQQLGFLNGEKVPDELQTAVNSHDFGLLPHGGVAFLLPEVSDSRVKIKLKQFEKGEYDPPMWQTSGDKTPNRLSDFKGRGQRHGKTAALAGKAFCFLPLPEVTGLPVHVNGHFCLDHESRRHLWKDNPVNSQCYRTLWNRCINENVISDCYVSALHHLKMYLFQEHQPALKDGVREVRNRLSAYHELFPIHSNIVGEYWTQLTCALYRQIDSEGKKLFPVIHTAVQNQQQGEVTGRVEWVGLKAVDDGKFQSLFSNIKDDITRAKNGKLSSCKKNLEIIKIVNDIQKIMKELGMKLIDCPMHLFDSIEKSGVSVKKLEPCHIRDFLKSFNEIGLLDHCRLMVDVPLAETVFQSTDLIHIVLEYCNLDDKLLEHLDGLPLLVTQDEVLRVFKTDKPVFSSIYCELISSATSLNKLFLHHSLVRWLQLLGHSCSVFKRFTIKTFADFLPDILDASMYKSENYIDWNPQASTIANKRWIEKVWLFFLDDMHKTFELLKRDVHEEVKIRMTEENLNFLEDWCLYPAYNGSNTFLVAVCKTKIVLNIYSFQGKLLEALRKLDLPRPHTKFPEEVRKQFLTMAACSKNAEFVLHCLYKQKEKLMPAQFSSSDAECVLQFFNDRLSELRQNISRDILVHRLRSLPFYETAAGQMTMLPQSCTTIVVPSEIPKQGLDEWAKQSNYKLLKKNHVLFQLHEHLHFCLKTAEELYYNHIILSFNNLPQHAWIHHIKFIKDKLLGLRKYVSITEFSDSQSELIQCLTNLSFLQGKNEHQLCKASDFFSPFDSVFKAMLEGEVFPPAPYCGKEWREFMEVIGMKKVVTTDMFVQFAKQVEQEGKQAITDTVKEKSNVLVKHLFARKKVWNDPVLQRISNIYFLAPYKADKQYTDICPQKECTRNFIAFSDSVPPSLVKLSWTTHNILLRENYPDHLSFNMTSENKEKILVELGICFSPSVDNVIIHIQNVCDSLKTLLDSPEKRKSLNTGVIDEVMKSFYQYLLPKLKDEGKDIIRKRLHITPILFLKEDNCMVPAQQAVQNLSKDQQIKPYLVKAPVHYGEFFPLFEYLGTEAHPTANHFAKVLSALHEETDDEKLEPNELKSMCMAVNSLFEKLHHGRKDENNELTVNKLYLPSKENKLVLSTELIFPDNAYYEERIGIQDQLFFFAGFTKLEMDIFDPLREIQKIPEMHRPTMLTSIIREHLVCKLKDVFSSDKTKTLQDFLHTPEFFNAVVRLIQHKRQKQTDPDQEPEEEQEQIWNSLQQIKIAQVSDIKTELTVQNCCIPSSRQTVKCFCDLSQKDGKEHLLYITDCNISSVISELLKLLVQYVHKSLQRCKRHLTFIVLVYIQTPEEIKSYLDNENVRQCNVSLDNLSLFPPLGTIVPPKLHHLLDNSFCDFTNGEYVALELFDKEIDSNSIDTEGLDAHFIYARVVRKIQTAAHSECMTQLLQKYDVNIGDKSIQVVALDIYKFHGEKKSKSKELVPVEIIPTPQSTLSLDQIKRKIKELLMESWSLSEDQRKKIIKRLILKWHPDKNHGNEDLCTEVFQFIQNILCRLENGENLDDDDVDGASRHPRTARSYYNFGERMFRRGQSYASHRKDYYSHREDSDYYAFYSNYKHEPQPNPLESKRWMKQAKCDLEAAKITIAVANQFQCCNWVCYKCQQSAEKALIAAWYARDSRKVNRSHDLPTVASGLGEELEKWAKQLQDLIGDHRRMRYPETGRMLNIPSDIYTRNMAEQAWKIAHNIVNRVAESH